MVAYTVEITNGSSTYTFDVQPEWLPSLELVHDETRSPAILATSIETWSLVNAIYRNATPSNVTTDFSTLAALLENRSTPINSIKFKSDTTTIRELSTSTHAQIMVKELTTESEGGAWANHWRGNITIVAKKLLTGSGATADLVRLERRYNYKYDDAGLLTQTLDGRVETKVGTSAKTKAQAQSDASLGSAFIFETGGDDHIEINVENADDTIATFKQVQRQIGVTIPSTATSYGISVEVSEGPDGKITTTQVRARGTSVAGARTAVRAAKPSSKLWKIAGETEDRDGRGFQATYVQREPRTLNRYQKPTVVSMRRSYVFQGGGQSYLEDPIPGFNTFVTLGPWRWLMVRESVTVTAINVTGANDIPLPAILWPDNLQANESDDSAPELDGGESEKTEADRYVRHASRVYVFPDPDALPSFEEAVNSILQAPGFADDPDYVTRTRRKET